MIKVRDREWEVGDKLRHDGRVCEVTRVDYGGPSMPILVVGPGVHRWLGENLEVELVSFAEPEPEPEPEPDTIKVGDREWKVGDILKFNGALYRVSEIDSDETCWTPIFVEGEHLHLWLARDAEVEPVSFALPEPEPEPEPGMNAAGNRMNGGKTKWTLTLRRMWPALRIVCNVTEFGSRKYAVDGWWNNELDEDETCDAAVRHVLAVLSGVYIDAAGETHYGQEDPESGFPHWAHAAWNCLALGALRIKRQNPIGGPK